MKLASVQIEGFRGALPPFELKLDEKSCFVLGENGFGKSTVADAVELWSVGDIKAYHRARCPLGAAIHLDASVATVEIRTNDPSYHLRRTLPGNSASDLTVVGPSHGNAPSLPPLPLLRHDDMREFMDKRSGDKKRELLDLLGLSQAGDFRDVIRAALTPAKRELESANANESRERRVLLGELSAQDLLQRAETLRATAELPGRPVATADDLRSIDLGTVPPGAGAPDRLSMINDLVRSTLALPTSFATEWNQVVADREVRSRQALAALLEHGQRVLADWHEDSCPLCGSIVDPEALREQVLERSKALADAKDRLDAAGRDVDNAIASWRLVEGALSKLLANPPDGGWPRGNELAESRTHISQFLIELSAARRDLLIAPNPPLLDVDSRVDELKTAATSGLASKRTAALLELAGLQAQVRRLDEAKAVAASRLASDEALRALLKIAEDQIGTAITSALDELSDLIGDYYGRLVSGGVYSDVKLEYDPRGRAGEVEFSVTFDGREKVSPPQRIMSSSQLNSLALALFLARLKKEDQPWRVMVLDDVVNSFDSPHRHGLIRLLVDEFPDWQVLLFSHDRAFEAVARHTVAGGWRFRQICQWTPSGGPILAEGDLVLRLDQRLKAGHAARDLSGLARQALEESLARPLRKLGYPIRYDPVGRFAAGELLTALRAGLSHAGASLGSAVLNRIQADSYMTTLGVHYRPGMPDPSVDDLSRVVEDLRDLESEFTCGECQQAVWSVTTSSGHHRCGCKKLAA